jgi:hypothetical protein
VALALLERHGWSGPAPVTPIRTLQGPVFRLHDHAAARVQVFGSWDRWQAGVAATEVEPAVWETRPVPMGRGDYRYKFLVGDSSWLPDPTNPYRAADGQGGINSCLRWPD